MNHFPNSWDSLFIHLSFTLVNPPFPVDLFAKGFLKKKIKVHHKRCMYMGGGSFLILDCSALSSVS